MKRKKDLAIADKSLIRDVRDMIEEARASVAATVNTGLTMLYWRIGRRINQDILKEGRAEYGEAIVSTLSRQLQVEYGRGFSAKNLRHMIHFADVFADEAIVSTLWRQLSWSHFKEIIYQKDALQRDFYAEMCRVERWSVRTLRQKIDSMLYERTAISNKPEELIRHEIDALRRHDQLTPDLIFKDPYLLDFLGLRDHYLEKDMEDAILRELEQFLLELGAGFSFIARQKRIQVDNDDYYIDLLFFNRKLKRLLVIELKLGDFKPADKGQMELYLRWLDKYERQADELSPIGLVLCAGKKRETVELLALEASGIRVAEYMTELPSRKVLEQKLHAAIVRAKKTFENRLELTAGKEDNEQTR
jgi:predicted nuclease of restriction endonuclease-like (RecB) superfamily